MRRLAPFALAACAAAAAATALPAQSLRDSVDTPRGRCAVWTTPVGASAFPRDGAYTVCALDRAPVLPADAPMPPAPRIAGHVGGWYRIVVQADGTVDSALTRAASVSGDDAAAHAAVLATLRRWRFTPGMRAGAPVRSAIDLEVRSELRPVDTLPARLVWRHVAGWPRDSLVGTWSVDAPLPALAPEVEDSVHAAIVRRLAAMLVVQPTARRRYCLAGPEDGAAADDAAASHARRRRLARALAPQLRVEVTTSCADGPGRVRLALPRLYHTEDGRVIARLAGAELVHWPAGFDGRAWSRWTARCVADVRDPVRVHATCAATPVGSDAEHLAWFEARRHPAPPARRPRDARTSLRLTVFATMTGADAVDTFVVAVRRVPRLRDVALRDSVAACNTWTATTARDSGVHVIHGDPLDRWLDVTRANVTSTPVEPYATYYCGAPSSRPDRFVALLAGGVGTRPTAPVTLCMGRCTRRYVLDARRHTLAPAFTLPIAALRPSARSADGIVRLRLVVDPVPDRLLPLVVFVDAAGAATSAHVPRHRGGGMWDWDVLAHGVDRATRRAVVYLVVR